MEEIPYFSPTLLLDDLAPEAGIFLDYDDEWQSPGPYSQTV
jgi:hypothetical protein